MASLPFRDIEKKWQVYWEANKTFRTPVDVDTSKPKYYVLDMFPYPSGSGLHVGHPEGYTATDIVARYKRMKGFNVLHPIGWDAFGLPAEQYALRTGTHPRKTTAANVDRFREQLKQLGLSYDWDREIDTTDPAYYRWTQWIFGKLMEKGLAYEAEVPVWWCEKLGTTLANEEVIAGKSEIGGYPCERRSLRQWMLRITEYAERLLKGLDSADWPTSTKEMQRNWIGRSEGAEIDFKTANDEDIIRVYTTRPDTLFGATYMVLSPEHELVPGLTTPEYRSAVDSYKAEAARKSDLERTELQKGKTGVFTGSYAVNPASGDHIPVWIADYVLTSYGTGAIMGVPGQDDRDWAFAATFDLPIKRTVQPPDDFVGKAYQGDGPAINSGFLDGLRVHEAKARMIAWLTETGRGRRKVNYKLRDWLFSRQRYWGEPLPIIYVDGVARRLPEKELPVALPDLKEFKPSGSPEGPLSLATDWLNTTDPETGASARRETNTMPQWAGSCWYYLRYIDPDNTTAPVDPEKEKYWMPVDLYVGGAEHAVLHLLYARFWHMVLYDAGIVSTPEPFVRLVHQGMILGELEYTSYHERTTGRQISAAEVSDGVIRGTASAVEATRVAETDVTKEGDHFVLRAAPEIQLDVRAHKMSKSRNNVVNPDDIVSVYGADAFRLYEMFMGPLEQVKPWNTRGVEGTSRFLNRVWKLFAGEQQGLSIRVQQSVPTLEQYRLLHRTIQRISNDIEALRMNTAIAALMEFINAAYKWQTVPRKIAECFVLLLAPFAPHVAEELWERLGYNGTLAYEPWPGLEEQYLQEDLVKVAVQVNGKVRGTVEVPTNADQAQVLAAAQGLKNVSRYLESKRVRKKIYVPGRIINFVVG